MIIAEKRHVCVVSTPWQCAEIHPAIRRMPSHTLPQCPAPVSSRIVSLYRAAKPLEVHQCNQWPDVHAQSPGGLRGTGVLGNTAWS
jgi:hypothetical protein